MKASKKGLAVCGSQTLVKQRPGNNPPLKVTDFNVAHPDTRSSDKGRATYNKEPFQMLLGLSEWGLKR